MIDEKKIEKVKAESIMKVKKESINDNYYKNIDSIIEVIDLLGMNFQVHFGDGASYRIDIVDDRQSQLDMTIEEVIKKTKLDEVVRKTILSNWRIKTTYDDSDGYEYAGLEDDCSYTKGGDNDEV